MAETLSADLSKVDPADAWKPWAPSAAAPWGRKWVAHLYRRAAFGPSPADTARALADGLPKTLDRLMAGEPDGPDTLDLAALTDAGRYITDVGQLRVWWLYAMVHGGHPLREKLTLFWHNHFATSHAKVRSTKLMFEQNVLLRKHALGKFRPLLLDMSKDTAMLVWLDSNRNVKGAANENYAREVMELFSLGVGNYTEKDVQEAARAFTGWHHDPEVTTFENNPDLHDDGPKTLLGQTGNFGGADVVRICADQPACARFLVGKMYAFLVSETKPPAALLAPLEERFRASDYDTADLVKTILGSRLFFSPHAYRRRVKWPVEYALGAVRAVVPGRVPLGDFADPLSKMGQALFAPPNVKGWRTGTDWLNSATLLARNNFAETVATGNWQNSAGGGKSVAVKESVATATVEDVATPDTSPPDVMTYPVGAFASAGGAAGAYTGFPTATSPDGKVYLVPGLAGPGGPAPGPGAAPPGSPGAPPKPGPGPTPPAAPPAPPQVDVRFDPAGVLFEPQPASVAALVARMGELLYGEPVPPAARAKVEKFLLDGKKSLATKDLANPVFKQKAREALHALMCLPEYQLN